MGHASGIDGNGNPFFIDWCDAYAVKAAGRVWRFEWHPFCGPTWLRADGEPRVRDVPDAVWRALDRWLKTPEGERAKGGA